MEEVSPKQLDAALEATTRRAMPAIFLGVGAFYVIAILATPLLPPDSRAGPQLLARWAATAVIGLAGAYGFRRWPPRPGWANPAVALLGVATVLNSLFLVQQGGPAFLFAVLVAIVAFSLFLLSVPWLVGLASLAFIGWILLAHDAGWGPEWTARTFSVLAAGIVAFVTQSMRVGLHRRLEILKARDHLRLAREAELARERALGEQRLRIVRMTAHELATPLTPVMLQMHLLERSGLTPSQQQTFDTMQRNLERLQETIKKVVKAAQADEAASDYYEASSEHTLSPSPPSRPSGDADTRAGKGG